MSGSKTSQQYALFTFTRGCTKITPGHQSLETLTKAKLQVHLSETRKGRQFAGAASDWNVVSNQQSFVDQTIDQWQDCFNAYLSVKTITLIIFYDVFLRNFVTFCRDAMQAWPMASCVVCASVCLSCSYILSKWMKISSKIFTIGVPFLFFHTKRDGDIPTGTPITGHRMQMG